MTLVQDAMNASVPGTAKQFLGSVQPKPVGQMVMYVGLLGLLGVIGTVIGLSVVGVCWAWVCFKWPITSALISGIVGWIGMIIAIVGAGMVVSALSQGMVGRQVPNEEAVTLAGFAATPALLAGILNIIPGVGGILVLVAALYSAYLFFLGSGVRFGQDKAIVVTIIYIVFLIVISLIFGLIASSIYSPVVWGGPGWRGVMPY